LQNHLHVTLAILHTDRGGEFSSIVFKSFLSENGIILEQGPANSPQKNGLAEQFNQTIIVKMRCRLAELAVPLNYWDKAAWFASTLINMLPLSSLNWRSPNLVLCNSNKLIEQVRKVQTLLPFGLKVYVHDQNLQSKISPPSKPLIFLGYKPLATQTQKTHPPRVLNEELQAPGARLGGRLFPHVATPSLPMKLTNCLTPNPQNLPPSNKPQSTSLHNHQWTPPYHSKKSISTYQLCQKILKV
jgi:hypothetical protein